MKMLFKAEKSNMGGVYTYSLYALVQTIQIYVGYDISKSS